MKSSLVVCWLAIAPVGAPAQTMYKCVEGGVTTYAERPCGKSAVAVEIRVPTPAPPPAPSRSDDRLQAIRAQVAIDAVKRFTIVERNGGSAMDLCVQAGSVTAALLQAEQADLYRKWLEIRRSACHHAGIRR